jgi:hypothetical protein
LPPHDLDAHFSYGTQTQCSTPPASVLPNSTLHEYGARQVVTATPSHAGF